MTGGYVRRRQIIRAKSIGARRLNTAPSALVLRTGGTNCDEETVVALELVGVKAERVHVGQVVNGACNLGAYEILVVPGGFSYGDDVSAGKLLANELVSQLREPLDRFVADGKLVLGICNGFQVLVHAGLLPGEDGLGVQTATLAPNDSGKFECRWVLLQPVRSACAFTAGLERTIELPVAHREGKFVAPQEALDRLEGHGQVVFRYVGDHDGTPSYPDNPNGSERAIAGVCNAAGTVLGMMPHPERFVRRLQHPRWTRESLPEDGDGLAIFQGAATYVRENLV